jgi:hypothetical protein
VDLRLGHRPDVVASLVQQDDALLTCHPVTLTQVTRSRLTPGR